MLDNITIGQYFPTGSVIHRLDARIKIILTLVFIVAIFLANNLLLLGACAVLCIVAMFMSKVKVRMFLKNLKAIWFIILLTSVLNIFYIDGDVIWSYGALKITEQGLERAAFIAVRICLLIIISSMLTYTTSPTELTDAMERLLSPLKFIGLGEVVHILAMMTSIALRFIPILIEEVDKITAAQKARGANLDQGSVIKRVRAMVPILIPLLISATRRAYDLAESMECRCYHGGKGRTKMKQAKLKPADFTALFTAALIIAAIICGRIIL